MSFLSDIWEWLSDLLSKIWKWIKDIIPYLLLALALYVGFMTGPGIAFLGMLIPAGWTSAAIIAGVSFLLFPEETAALGSAAVAAVGKVAGEVASELGSTLGTGISALASASGISTLLLVAGAGLLLWLMMSGDDAEDDAPEVTSVSANTNKLQGGQLYVTDSK